MENVKLYQLLYFKKPTALTLMTKAQQVNKLSLLTITFLSITVLYYQTNR